MATRNSRKCDTCGYTFATPQRLRSHQDSKNGRVCLRRLENLVNDREPNQQVDSEAKFHVGIDVDNDRYYWNLIEDAGIAIPYKHRIGVADLIKLFKQVHRVKRPNYGYPIVRRLGTDVFEYYNG